MLFTASCDISNAHLGKGYLFLQNQLLKLHAYADADRGACLDSCKSVLGQCVFVSNSLILWKLKKQFRVSDHPLRQNIVP